MKLQVRLFLCGLALAAAPSSARADDWPSPQVREQFDSSRDHFVRVIPGESWGDVFGFSGADTGRYATAEFYRRRPDRSYELAGTHALLNPIAPVEFFVSGSGRLVTIDNWHNRGYGAVVAIYDADGSVVSSYKLADLFSHREIEAFSFSMSSIAWHEGPAFIRGDQQTVLVTVANGATLLFGLETGKFKYCEMDGQTYRCRAANETRVWKSNAEVPDPR